ncbi:sugar ABC transporter permease, partial [Mycobacterium tuberculosis]|nr:sugar ABC transporter permease [Mycobacterium tuberculosis]
RLARPNDGAFVGLANYARLAETPAFYASLRITLVYAAAAVVLGVTLGVVSALAIDRPFRGRAIVRAVLLFGWAVPNV